MRNAIHRNIYRCRRMIGGIVAFGLLLALAPAHAAHAQQAGAGMFLEMTRPDYLHRDMLTISQELDLDDSQRMILDTLYEDYRASFESGWMGVQESMTKSLQQQEGDVPRQTAIDLVLKPLEEWHTRKQQMKQRFEQDVRVILNEEQNERWPALERRITREKTLHLGRLSGEAVDLFNIVRQQQLGAQQSRAIEPMLEQYGIELDRALRERNQMLENYQLSMIRQIRETGDRMRDHVRNTEREVQSRLAVREVNDRYIESIASALPYEAGQRFQRAALETGYPRAYRPIAAQRVFERALTLDTLEDDIRQSIHDLQMIMATELEVINRQIHQQTRNHEPKALIHDAKLADARAKGEQLERLDDPTRQLVLDREDHAEYYVLLLRDMLTDEEFASIPGTQRWRERSVEANVHPARELYDPRRTEQREATQRATENRRGERTQRGQSRGGGERSPRERRR